MTDAPQRFAEQGSMRGLTEKASLPDPRDDQTVPNFDHMVPPAAEQAPLWRDGDAITRTYTGETWTRVEGVWWCDLGGEPKTDAHATRTVEAFDFLITVHRVTPPAVATGDVDV